MQFVLGRLTDAGILHHPIYQYVPLITDELLQAFPLLETAPKFDLET